MVPHRVKVVVVLVDDPSDKTQKRHHITVTLWSFTAVVCREVFFAFRGDVLSNIGRRISWGFNADSRKVCDVVPHMSRVHCEPRARREETTKHSSSSLSTTLQNDDDDKNNTTKHDMTAVESNMSSSSLSSNTDPPARKKQKINPDLVVDLTADDDDDDDDGIITSVDDPRPPSKVITDYWIHQSGPLPYNGESELGKWLVFCGEHFLDETWNKIALAVKSGDLHAIRAKVSTNHSVQQMNRKNSSHVICVYTSRERMDDVGMRLIPFVRRDLRYKTNEMTEQNIYYSGNGVGSVATKASEKTLYWNRGQPSTTKRTTKLLSEKASLFMAKQASSNNNNNKLSLVFHHTPVTVSALQHYYYKHHDSPPKPGTKVVLVRQPDNPHDKNAIAVYFLSEDDDESPEASLSSSSSKSLGIQVGFVKKNEAQVLAPWLDRNLIKIQTAAIHHCLLGQSTTYDPVVIELEGRACPEAKDLLAGF